MIYNFSRVVHYNSDYLLIIKNYMFSLLIINLTLFATNNTLFRVLIGQGVKIHLLYQVTVNFFFFYR